MGHDKTLLEIDGIPLVTRVVTALTACLERVVLVGNRPERFAALGLPVLPDLYPGSALGGLCTGLVHAETPWLFVASCDLSCPDSELVRYLCSIREGYDAVVPRSTHGYEPLFALYAAACLAPMRSLLGQGICRITDLYPLIRVREVSGAELAPFDQNGRAFLNLNTPAQFVRAGGVLPS